MKHFCCLPTAGWLLCLWSLLPLHAEPFLAEKLTAMDGAITQAIAEGKCPGGVLWLERRGEVYQKAFGHRAVEPKRETMTLDTIFDAASLTKVVACAPAIVLLAEQGKLELDAPVRAYISEFDREDRQAITVRHLLTHTSGLPAGISTAGDWQGQAAALERACTARIETSPGQAFKYSDVNFILLGEIVRRVGGKPLEVFVQEAFYRPLKMPDTGYLPPTGKLSRVAPTERDGDRWLRGTVHDPTARKMGGVAGHAGLFTTAADLARFARMLLNGGELEGVRVFQSESVRLMTRVQSPPGVGAKRGLGWDIDSSYSGPRGEVFPSGSSFGHTGWTGTSLWIDPVSETFVIFLSNRNHPTRDGNVLALRRTLGTLAAEAAGLSATNANRTATGTSPTP